MGNRWKLEGQDGSFYASTECVVCFLKSSVAAAVITYALGSTIVSFAKLMGKLLCEETGVAGTGNDNRRPEGIEAYFGNNNWDFKAPNTESTASIA